MSDQSAENTQSIADQAKAAAESARATAADYTGKAADASRSAAESAKSAARDPSQEFTIRVPVGKIASTAVEGARVPIEVARQVLPKGGLPMYAGIGALAVIGMIDWPVAAAAGAGYAFARLTRGASQQSRPQTPPTPTPPPV
ncbi:MAG: hypothetical protein JO345_07390 [Streptosporangiaceae bacterium]|nr:hypothetical protein [Streptosporangiaceae bacterium]